METQKVDLFIATNSKSFEGHLIPSIREQLLALPEEKWTLIQSLSFKDPIVALIISLLAGGLGIDRFYIGDTGLGLIKLFTCGGFGIWAFIDLFLIMGAAKDKNYRLLQQVLTY